jgi:hypothetical protein
MRSGCVCAGLAGAARAVVVAVGALGVAGGWKFGGAYKELLIYCPEFSDFLKKPDGIALSYPY